MTTLTSTNKASQTNSTNKARITVRPSKRSKKIWTMINKELNDFAVISSYNLEDTDIFTYALDLKRRGLIYTSNSILNCIRLN
jgi:hypothetical protein